jgi:hypothetical protein
VHSDAEINLKISRLLVGEDYVQVARDGLDHLGAFTPVRFEAPPSWLASAVEQTRQLIREKNYDAARHIVATIASGGQGMELGKYRDTLYWAEGQNARKLAALAWMWSTLVSAQQRARGHLRVVGASNDVELDRKLEQLERFVVEHYGVSELRTERGWADSVARQYRLLPTCWRMA